LLPLYGYTFTVTTSANKQFEYEICMLFTRPGAYKSNIQNVQGLIPMTATNIKKKIYIYISEQE
jgi:hypothetical protein